MNNEVYYLEDYCITGEDFSGDAFFIDTNFLLAFINDKHPNHISTVIHTIFLLIKNAKLYISETVLSEAIDVLARTYYTDDKFNNWINSDDYNIWVHSLYREPNDNDFEDKKREFRTGFIKEVVKDNSNLNKLKDYNSKAVKALSGVIESELFKLSNTTYGVIKRAAKIAESIPLQSNDALIASAAMSKKGSILTYDSDFKNRRIIYENDKVDIFTMKFTNNYLKNHAIFRMKQLDQALPDQVKNLMGTEKFIKNFTGNSE